MTFGLCVIMYMHVVVAITDEWRADNALPVTQRVWQSLVLLFTVRYRQTS